ncbi:hypothetical protein [Methylorubrum zatmanii]
MTLSYPANLPFDGLREGYSIQNSGQALMKSPMQSGKIRLRPQFTLRIVPVQFQIYFSPQELGVWRDFLWRQLGDGAAEFTMPIWDASRQQYVTRLVQIRDGAEGVSEQPFADDQTLVTGTLNVRGF